ncbi:MAG: ABC transporter permease subunit, partial [bacterium]
AFLGPLVGLALGFDGINGERTRGTLSRLLGQPVTRDAVINAKYLAGLAVLGLMIFSLGFLVAGLGLIMIGVPPTGEEMGRILIFLLLTVIYVGFWLGLSLLFSVQFRQTATSALAGIALWLFFTVFVGLLAGIVADTIAPVARGRRWAPRCGTCGCIRTSAAFPRPPSIPRP